MRNPKPKTTAVGVLREGSALIDASSTTVELTKEGYQQSRQQDNPPTQRELPLDDHPA